MGYFDKFNEQSNKLANILEENGLLHTFKTKSYPLTLTVSQNQAPEAQMALYEQDKGDISSSDAKLVLTFPVGEIGVRVYGRLCISDTLMGKIKNHGKKMRDLYLQGYYAAQMKERGPSPVDTETEDTEDEEAKADFAEFMEDDTATETDTEE